MTSINLPFSKKRAVWVHSGSHSVKRTGDQEETPETVSVWSEGRLKPRDRRLHAHEGGECGSTLQGPAVSLVGLVSQREGNLARAAADHIATAFTSGRLDKLVPHIACKVSYLFHQAPAEKMKNKEITKHINNASVMPHSSTVVPCVSTKINSAFIN